MNNREKIWNEIAIIILVPAFFLSAAVSCHRTAFHENRAMFMFIALIDLLLLVYFVRQILTYVFTIRMKRGVRTELYKNRGIFFLLFYIFVTRIPQWSDRPRWDALTYYEGLVQACQNFDFTLTSLVRDFSLARHPTLGFAVITAIGEFIDPDGYVGVKIVWLCVSLLSGYCLYRILEKILPSCSWVYHFLAACAVMSTPLVLGTFHYYQPDAGLVCFFIFVIYCFLYRRHILLLGAMLLLTQSKEVGAVALIGFECGLFLFFWISERKAPIKKRFLKFIKTPACFCGAIAFLMLIFWFLFYRESGGRVWSHRDSTWSSPLVFRPDFVWFKCKQYFILNFNWLMWGGNILLTVIIVLKKRREMCISEQRALWAVVLPVCFTAVALMAFYACYITYTAPRYHVLIDMCGMLLLVCLFGFCFSGFTSQMEAPRYERNWCNFFIGGLTVLFLTGAYITIDPVSLAVFKADDTGEGYIIYEDYWELDWRTDFTVYNHQFAYLDHVYDAILRDVGYNEEMDVIVWDYVELGGLLHDTEPLYWNTKRNQRTLLKNENSFLMNAVVREQVEKQEVFLHDSAVFITPLQFGPDIEFSRNWLQKQKYQILSEGFVRIPFGGKMTYFVCRHD